MRYEVIFRPQARDEAVAAADYIAAHASPELALQWYKGLEAGIESLNAMPARCPFAREHAAFASIELRQLVYASHRLIFTIRGRQVHILHVRHTAQANLDGPPAMP